MVLRNGGKERRQSRHQKNPSNNNLLYTHGSTPDLYYFLIDEFMGIAFQAKGSPFAIETVRPFKQLILQKNA
jgi:hypothetical protein